VTTRGSFVSVGAAVLLCLAVATLAYVGRGQAEGRPAYPAWAAVGDSITYGVGSSDPATRAYPVRAGVTGHGISGQCLVTTGCHGRPLVETFPRDLGYLRQHDVHAVVVEIGINDLGHVTDQQYVDAYARLRADGAAQGVRVVLSTITPFGVTHPVPAGQEQQRERVNAWIRSRGAYVDYDAALSNGRGLDPSYDSGDGMHPDDAGHARMAEALDSWITQDGRSFAG
jgi:lysophospholipase L1-like esterase